ncbi:BgTH12-06164 [Blumeria graminis f. sp. triticale]|uniref:BgTH12-06164 n=1 Tax=Blumeria graminis f. sp. triticale TaxID=1689686 RepID=A0A9W4DMC7_BLUGR|nr:BgTH12-06164 [Blumeria graminis f. sp. triticale]
MLLHTNSVHSHVGKEAMDIMHNCRLNQHNAQKHRFNYCQLLLVLMKIV